MFLLPLVYIIPQFIPGAKTPGSSCGGFKNNIISEENISERVYELEQEIAFNRGNGNVEITEEYKQQKNQEIISGQESTLSAWIDYLSSEDAMYPMWAKYWALQSVLKVGKYNKEKKSFDKRGKNSVAPFPPMNAGVIAKSIAVIQEKIKGGEIENFSNLDEEEFQKALNKEDFSKIYALALESLPEFSEEGLENIKGEWVVYQQIQDKENDEIEIHPVTQKLFDSLQGYPLEWCTAQNIDTAENQLSGGDFLVYYSENAQGENKIPRVAIRMEKDNIAEVRGIEAGQEMDRFILPVVEDKMKEFGGEGEEYKKKVEDMKILTEIYSKSFEIGDDGQKMYLEIELSKESLVFLYEFNSKITGFGYGESDPRISELLARRDFKKDMYNISDGLDDTEVFIYLLNSNFTGIGPERVKLFELNFDEVNESDIDGLDNKNKLRAQRESDKILSKVNNGVDLSPDDLRILYGVGFAKGEIATFDGVLEKELPSIFQKRDLKDDINNIFGIKTEDKLIFLASRRESHEYIDIINEHVNIIYESWNSIDGSVEKRGVSKPELAFLYSLNYNSARYEYHDKISEIISSRNSIEDMHRLYPSLHSRKQVSNELLDKYKKIGLLETFEEVSKSETLGDPTENLISNRIENGQNISKADFLYTYDLHKEVAHNPKGIVFNVEKYEELKSNKKDNLELDMLALKMLGNIKNIENEKDFEMTLITDLSNAGMLDVVLDNISRFKSLGADEIIKRALEHPGGYKIYNILGHVNISERKLLTILLNDLTNREEEVLENIDKFSLNNSEIFNIFIKYFSKREEGYIYMDDLIKLLSVAEVSKNLILTVFSNFYIRGDNFPAGGKKEYIKFLDIVEKQGHDTLGLTKDIVVNSKHFDAGYIMGSVDVNWHNEIAHELIKKGKIFTLKDNLFEFKRLDKFVYDNLVEYGGVEVIRHYKNKFIHLIDG